MNVLSVTTLLVAVIAICEVSAVGINQRGYRCTPGTTFKDDEGCNDCRCRPDGKGAVCTEKACIKVKRETKIGINQPGYRCVPGSSFKDDQGCNDCRCNDKGTFAACTLKLCIKHKRAALTPYDVDYPCEPESRFQYKCNTCKCSKTGIGAACTRRACPPEPRDKRAVSTPTLGQPGFSCTPGKAFPSPDGCNSCTCMKDGKNAMCTLMACHHHHKRSAADRSCQPGTVVRSPDGCNKCACREDGTLGVCTQRACLPVVKRSAVTPDDPNYPCEPNTRFEYRCNSCKCSASGKGAACTRRACPDHKNKREVAKPGVGEDGFTCEPGKSFPDPDGCNMCTCDQDGKNAFCTLKACPSHHHQHKRSDDEKNCEPGSVIQRECNSCNCVPGVGYACTKRACVKEPKHTIQKRDDDKNCEPGSVIQRECNSCNCVPGIGYACTKRACFKVPKQTIQKREESVEKEFNGTSCAPTDKFMIDCNTCYCNNNGSGYSCTQINCSNAKT